jgi:hypothetical protein
MKKYRIVTEDDDYEFDADVIDLQDGIISIIKNHIVIAQFSNWNLWYEEKEDV